VGRHCPDTVRQQDLEVVGRRGRACLPCSIASHGAAPRPAAVRLSPRRQSTRPGLRRIQLDSLAANGLGWHSWVPSRSSSYSLDLDGVFPSFTQPLTTLPQQAPQEARLCSAGERCRCVVPGPATCSFVTSSRSCQTRFALGSRCRLLRSIPRLVVSNQPDACRAKSESDVQPGP